MSWRSSSSNDQPEDGVHEDWSGSDDDEEEEESPEDDADTETRECPACGADVYEFADRCPKCGEAVVVDRPERKPRKLLVAAVLIVLLIVATFMCF